MFPESIDKNANKGGKESTWIISNGNDNSPNLANYNDADIKNNIQKTFPEFFEKFDILDYINPDRRIVYVVKNNSKKNSFAFKFTIEKNKCAKLRKASYPEIYYQKTLHHNNISQILAFHKINEQNFFSISEFSVFGDLSYYVNKILKRKVISEAFINFLAKQILEGINYEHINQKILYLNMKEDNIIIQPNLIIKLQGFSSSISFKGYKPNDIIKLKRKGIDRYMAPEIINEEQIEVRYGTKIDVYSLGVILYKLAFGFYPKGLSEIKEDEEDKMIAAINNPSLEFPKCMEISGKFKSFLENLLKKDYKKRYSIKDALNDPWIKGWDIINEEKENTGIMDYFFERLLNNNIPGFNRYIK